MRDDQAALRVIPASMGSFMQLPSPQPEMQYLSAAWQEEESEQRLRVRERSSQQVLRVEGHQPQKCYRSSMFHHWQPSIEQPMFRNVSGILKGAVPFIPKPLTSLRAAAHSRQNCWATSRALTTHRRSASVQCANTPIFPTSDSALQQLIDAEGRILR